MTSQCDRNLGRKGTYHVPARCDPAKIGDCQYILMWFYNHYDDIKFVIFSKEVDEAAIGFSSIQDQHFGESTLFTFNKNQTATENKIDKDGNKIARKNNVIKDVTIKKLTNNYLFVVFSIFLNNDTRNMLVKPGGSYYFVDGPSHNISDEKYVWLSHNIDMSYFFKDDNEKLNGSTFDTTTIETMATLQRHPCYDIVGDVLNNVLKKLNVKKKVQKKAAFLVEAILENRNEYVFSYEEDNKLFDENPE